MIVWGGMRLADRTPAGDTIPPRIVGQRPAPPTRPTARWFHTAIWTGSEMIVWGSVYTSTGGRYCANVSPQLGNISTRAFVQTGDNVVIGGFIVQGTQRKRVIIRAIGPELTQYGVPNALANPTLELHNATGALIASNNNWATTIIGGIVTANQVRDIVTAATHPVTESNLRSSQTCRRVTTRDRARCKRHDWSCSGGSVRS